MDKFNFDLVYGTHKMTSGIKHGVYYGCIDTATGYSNEDRLRKLIGKTEVAPCIITKFNQKDFDDGIVEVAKRHIDALGFEPDIILIHSTLRSHRENVNAFRILKYLFPNKLIGISNFDIIQTKFLIDNYCVPSVMQLEYHPFFQPDELVALCKSYDMMILAYRPFAKGSVLTNENIIALSTKYNIPANQLILKWIHSKGIIPVAASNNPINIASNAKYNKVTINNEICQTLDSMNIGIDGSTCMVKFSTIDGEVPVF